MADRNLVFTPEEVARSCVALVHQIAPHARLWIDPSIGDGAFALQFPSGKRKVSIDIDKRFHPDVVSDFLLWGGPGRGAKREHTVVCGNPPFTAQNGTNLAIKFLLHASTMAQTIGLIMGSGSCQTIIHRRLPEGFILRRAIPLHANTFRGNGSSRQIVRAHFFVFHVRDSPITLKLRPPPAIGTSPQIEILGPRDPRMPDMAIVRFGDALRPVGLREARRRFRARKQPDGIMHYIVCTGTMDRAAVITAFERIHATMQVYYCDLWTTGYASGTVCKSDVIALFRNRRRLLRYLEETVPADLLKIRPGVRQMLLGGRSP